MDESAEDAAHEAENAATYRLGSRAGNKYHVALCHLHIGSMTLEKLPNIPVP